MASTIANCNRDPHKGRAFTPDDFMPSAKKRRMTAEEMSIAMKDIAGSIGEA